MSAYEELVERCASAYLRTIGPPRFGVEAILAEVMRTLEEWARSNSTVYDEETLRVMLRASPLAPPKDGAS
jgi:hypothetical protein